MSDKTIRLLIDLTYNQDIMHGDDEEAIEWWFNDILLGDNLQLGDFGDLGDMIGSAKVIPHAADRIEELEAKLAKAVAQLEETNQEFAKTVGQRRHKAWITIRKTAATIAELEGEK